MREIEIKARVKDLDGLIKTIQQTGIKIPNPITQNDFIFVLKPFKLSEIKKGSSPILRIRNENGKVTLNLKKDITDQLDCLEHETVIDNIDEMSSILNEIGYHKVIEVRKIRRKFKLDDYKICIDEVFGLGAFVELEIISEGNVDVENTRLIMWRILHKFNITENDKVLKGYDRLLDELDINKKPIQ